MTVCATQASKLRLAAVVPESIVDGPGLRMTIFTQGCPHHCPGCHNPETHDPDGGCSYTVDEIIGIYQENPLLSGMTFSGGEPFMQAAPLALLARKVHELAGDIVTYTGFKLEKLVSIASENPAIKALLHSTDLLIDGPYLREERSLELLFRGSANQRLIHREELAHFL